MLILYISNSDLSLKKKRLENDEIIDRKINNHIKTKRLISKNLDKMLEK